MLYKMSGAELQHPALSHKKGINLMTESIQGIDSNIHVLTNLRLIRAATLIITCFIQWGINGGSQPDNFDQLITSRNQMLTTHEHQSHQGAKSDMKHVRLQLYIFGRD